MHESRVLAYGKYFVLLEKNYSVTKPFYLAEKIIFRRKKPSTTGVLLGRKPCFYQRKTFGLTVKNFSCDKPVSSGGKNYLLTTKKIILRRQAFYLDKTVFLPTLNIWSYWKKYYVTTTVFIRRKTVLSMYDNSYINLEENSWKKIL